MSTRATAPRQPVQDERPKAARSGAAASHRKTPRSDVRIRLREGDWLVQQTRSQSGIPRDQHETLADLGLLKIGRCGLFKGDRPEAWGQISRVQHLVAIRPLTRKPPKTRFRLSEGALVRAPAKPFRYEVGGKEARHYEFDGDSFMSVEPCNKSVAVNWSTALPIATVLEKLDIDFLKRVHSCTVFDLSRRAHLEVEPNEVLETLLAGKHSYPFVRMETEDLTLVWQQPTYPKHVDEDVSAGRIGVIVPKLDAKTLTQMVRDTATPEVGACVEELVEGVEEISSEFTRVTK